MRWWFSWSFKSFSLRYSIVCIIINFLFASLKLAKLLNNFVKGFEVITILLPLRWLQNLTLSHVEKNPFLCCFFSRFGLVCLQSFEKVKIWARKIFYFEKIQYKYKEMQDFKRFRNCWKIYKKVWYRMKNGAFWCSFLRESISSISLNCGSGPGSASCSRQWLSID